MVIRSSMSFMEDWFRMEDDQEELMPSCFCLNLLDCIFVNIASYCKNKTKPGDQV